MLLKPKFSNETHYVSFNEDGVTTTFIRTEDKVFCIEYVK